MHIAATAVSMEAARSSRELEIQAIGLLPAAANTPQTGADNEFGQRLATQIHSFAAMQAEACSVINQGLDPCPQPWADDGGESPMDALRTRLAQRVNGKPVMQANQEKPALTNANQPVGLQQPAPFATLASIASYHQEETQSFCAQGQVQTTDGRKVAFDFCLALHRSTTISSTTSLGLTTALVDPLVLQFDLDAPLLTESSFFFDLDNDGNKDTLACPGRGCGFLALDRNLDGCINNGSELFGPTSGAGFGELALLDDDANRWIDEGDPIFDQLLIWRPDGQGGEELTSLRQAGVGAISVVHAGTEFQLQSSSGELLGRIKGSGIFLTEAGEVRSLQEIDLATAADQPTIPAIPVQTKAVREALQALRAIIGLQRLRLSMMLTGQRMAGRFRSVFAGPDEGMMWPSWREGRQPSWTDQAGRIEGGPMIAQSAAESATQADTPLPPRKARRFQADADRLDRDGTARVPAMTSMLNRIVFRSGRDAGRPDTDGTPPYNTR